MRKSLNQSLAIFFVGLLTLCMLTACAAPSEDLTLLRSMGASEEIRNKSTLNLRASALLTTMELTIIKGINDDAEFTMNMEEVIGGLNDFADMMNPQFEQTNTKQTYASGGGFTKEEANLAMQQCYPDAAVGKCCYGIARKTIEVKGQKLQIVLVVFEN